jgi:hypothetical protein
VSRGRPARDEGHSSRRRERSARRRERSALRRERALVRRRLATPPPDYLSGSLADSDDGNPRGADGAEGASGRGPAQRRMRLRLALAALPLAVAVALFAATGLRNDAPSVSAGGPAAEDSKTVGSGMEGRRMEGPRMERAPLVPGFAHGAGDAMVPSDVADAADTAAVAGGVPGGAADEYGADGYGAGGYGAAGDGVAGDGAGVLTVPVAPSGHRPVAVRIADPAALSLVTVGDHVDVVGMDGSVLAERLEVLQDRSSGMGPVLVMAAPDGTGAELAAAALSREVTVILSTGPAVQGSAP